MCEGIACLKHGSKLNLVKQTFQKFILVSYDELCCIWKPRLKLQYKVHNGWFCSQTSYHWLLLKAGTLSVNCNIAFPDWKEVFYLPLLSAATGLVRVDQVGKKPCFLGKRQNFLQFHCILFISSSLVYHWMKTFKWERWELEFYN